MDSMTNGSQVSVEAKQSTTLNAFVANPGSEGASSGSNSELNIQSVSDMMASLTLNPLANAFIPSSSIPGLNHLAPPYHQMYPGVMIDQGYHNQHNNIMDWIFKASSSWDFDEIDVTDDSIMGNNQNIESFDVDQGSGIFGNGQKCSTMSSSPPGSSKKPRGHGSEQPASCLVDGCIADLSICRDYHRRHRWENDYNNESREREVRYRTRRTVFVSNIDNSVTEEQLAELFSNQGQVMDCRICGNPYSTRRFAFIEFADMNSAQAALDLSGVKLGISDIRVTRSKTAILPVNPAYIPQSVDEMEKCARTVCCTNIDNQVSRAELKHFFETSCGEVSVMRHLRDGYHATSMAFIEFVTAESAIRALDFCGEVLGMCQIRVNPSKTPVRPRSRPFA